MDDSGSARTRRLDDGSTVTTHLTGPADLAVDSDDRPTSLFRDHEYLDYDGNREADPTEIEQTLRLERALAYAQGTNTVLPTDLSAIPDRDARQAILDLARHAVQIDATDPLHHPDRRDLSHRAEDYVTEYVRSHIEAQLTPAYDATDIDQARRYAHLFVAHPRHGLIADPAHPRVVVAQSVREAATLWLAARLVADHIARNGDIDSPEALATLRTRMGGAWRQYDALYAAGHTRADALTHALNAAPDRAADRYTSRSWERALRAADTPTALVLVSKDSSAQSAVAAIANARANGAERVLVAAPTAELSLVATASGATLAPTTPFVAPPGVTGVPFNTALLATIDNLDAHIVVPLHGLSPEEAAWNKGTSGTRVATDYRSKAWREAKASSAVPTVLLSVPDAATPADVAAAIATAQKNGAAQIYVGTINPALAAAARAAGARTPPTTGLPGRMITGNPTLSQITQPTLVDLGIHAVVPIGPVANADSDAMIRAGLPLHFPDATRGLPLPDATATQWTDIIRDRIATGVLRPATVLSVAEATEPDAVRLAVARLDANGIEHVVLASANPQHHRAAVAGATELTVNTVAADRIDSGGLRIDNTTWKTLTELRTNELTVMAPLSWTERMTLARQNIKVTEIGRQDRLPDPPRRSPVTVFVQGVDYAMDRADLPKTALEQQAEMKALFDTLDELHRPTPDGQPGINALHVGKDAASRLAAAWAAKNAPNLAIVALPDPDSRSAAGFVTRDVTAMREITDAGGRVMMIGAGPSTHGREAASRANAFYRAVDPLKRQPRALGLTWDIPTLRDIDTSTKYKRVVSAFDPTIDSTRHLTLGAKFPQPVPGMPDDVVMPTARHAYALALAHRYDPDLTAKVLPNFAAQTNHQLTELLSNLEPNFTIDERVSTMLEVQRLKLRHHEQPRMQLLATGSVPLRHENNYGDSFWGIDRKAVPPTGQDHLAKIYTQLRTEMRNRIAASDLPDYPMTGGLPTETARYEIACVNERIELTYLPEGKRLPDLRPLTAWHQHPDAHGVVYARIGDKEYWTDAPTNPSPGLQVHTGPTSWADDTNKPLTPIDTAGARTLTDITRRVTQIEVERLSLPREVATGRSDEHWQIAQLRNITYLAHPHGAVLHRVGSAPWTVLHDQRSPLDINAFVGEHATRTYTQRLAVLKMPDTIADGAATIARLRERAEVHTAQRSNTTSLGLGDTPQPTSARPKALAMA